MAIEIGVAGFKLEKEFDLEKEGTGDGRYTRGVA